MKKVLFALGAFAIMASTHAQDNTQYACSFLAEVGRGAAQANASGLAESFARDVWYNNVDQNASGDYAKKLKSVGEREVHAIYKKGITNPEEGYWEGYQACVDVL